MARPTARGVQFKSGSGKKLSGGVVWTMKGILNEQASLRSISYLQDHDNTR